jgi:hypothetical protein
VRWRPRIDELFASGALDEGSGDVLDRLIDTWTQQQMHELEKKYIARRIVAEQLLAEADERRVVAPGHLKLVESRHQFVERFVAETQMQLLGTAAASDESDTRTNSPVEPVRESV